MDEATFAEVQAVHERTHAAECTWIRSANEGPTFYPMTDDDDRPEIVVAGVAVSVYVDDDGTFRVSIHTDTGEVAPQLISGDGETVGPIRIKVNDSVVWSS
jgi:uncharacterized protein YfaP (DUF2135 family)